MPPKPKRKSKKSAARIGERLLAGLTQQEIADLLDAVFKLMSAKLQEQALGQLQPDTRKTVQQILSSRQAAGSARSARTQSVSMDRLAQTWAECWSEWDGIVAEAAQEEGAYITQDEHWEPPYFDSTWFIEELEKVAAKMRPLLETAFQNGFAPELSFAEALHDAEQDIAAAMPEWMEIDDGIYLEQHLSTCLLHWEWLQARDEGQDAFVFAQRIRQWEDKFSYVDLDDNTLLDFFSQLSEADQKRILKGLSTDKEAPLWKKCLDNTYSHWHDLYIYYIEQYAPERHLETLRPTIAQQWQNGLPVIENLLAKKDYRESLTVIEETLAALLAFTRRDQPWTPETSLLFPIVARLFNADDYLECCKTLLRYYQQTAQGLQQSQRAHAVVLQLHAFDHCFDWHSMFKAFAEATIAQKTRQALFLSWQDCIVQRAKPYTMAFGVSEKADDNWWLSWLLESIFDARKGPLWFQKKLMSWLANLSAKSVTTEDFAYLRLLTKDVTDPSSSIKVQYPKFHEVVIRGRDLSTPDDASRQTYLAQYAPAELRDRVMSYWQTHLHTWLPRPEKSTMSDYTEHARWMTALRELAPDTYKTLLEQWRVDHRRRRNLWQAMAKMGLE